ncbi:MAG: hypothetical protein JO111_14560 [Caulobacteraceae bacterium]|nr:hypothetical protein [Caulobacteraceae bacterium]
MTLAGPDLDPPTLRRVAAGHTTLIIAHRLSTVVDADEIAVMEAGRVVERGDHRALLARGGIYARQWRRQGEGADNFTRT